MWMKIASVSITLLLWVAPACYTQEARFVVDQPSGDDLAQKVAALQSDLTNVSKSAQESQRLIRDLTNHLLTSNDAIIALQGMVKELQLKAQTTFTFSGGATYIRWGNTDCSASGTTLVYDGYAAGSDWQKSGAATDYLCLTRHPIWGHYNDSIGAGAKLYGAEYVLDNSGWVETSNEFFNRDVTFRDVPCALCHTQRSTTVMIPGRNTCLPGWTEEYHGYLAAGDADHAAGSQYVCMDQDPQEVPGGEIKNLGKLFYFTEAVCGSLKCPPYVNGREITCVVCSQ